MFAGRGFFACVLIGALVVVLLSSFSRAELLDHVPEDAVVYVGWQGTDALGETFDRSHFAAIRRSANADQLIAGVLPMAGLFMGEQAGQVAGLATELEQVLWQRPWALFVGDPASVGEGLGPQPATLPTVRLGLLVDADTHADQVRQALEQWEQALTDDDTPATWVEDDGVVGLLIGYNAQQARDIRIMWRSLSRDNAFNHARRQVMRDPALLAYIDTERLVGRLADTVAAAGLFDEAQVQATLAELGLDGLKRVVYAGGFKQRMWQTQWFVEAPAPRQGLLSLLDARPITDHDLAIVPRSATWLSAYRLDPAVALAVLNQVLPSSADDANASADLARDALAAGLGDLWLFYSDPTFVTPTGPGVALVHALRDPAAVETALSQLANQWAGDTEGMPAVEQVVVDGVTIHQAAAPDGSLALAWLVADGRLYMGTGATTVVAARAHAARPGNSITQNSRFQRVRERLGNPPAGARLTFADLQSTAPAMFQSYAHAMQLDGVGPAMPLPDLRSLMPYLFPAGQAGWADDHGWHGRSIAPCPAAGLLSPCATINLGTGTLAAALLLQVQTTSLAGP